MTRNADGLLVTEMHGGPSDGALWYWAVEPPRDYVHRVRGSARTVHLYLWTGELWSYVGVDLIETECKGK